MRIEFQEKDLGIFIYNVYLSEEEMTEIEERAFDYWRKEADIPGYRKGMAPKNIIYQKYSENIRKTFREILSEKIKQEISKRHKFSIDSIKIIDQKVNENKNLIEIPGQVGRNEFLFVVKVSSKTSIIVEDEEKIKNLIKEIKFVSYSLDKNTIDLDDLKKFFFSGKRLEDSVKDDSKKYVVELYIKISDKLPSINLHFYLENLPKLADNLKGKKIFEDFELSLDKETKEVINNYLSDMSIFDVEIPNKTKVVISKVILIEDQKEIIEENINLFSKSYGDPSVILPLVLESSVYRYNVSRLLSMSVAKTISNSKVYVGESEYISALISSISASLSEYSYGELHISSYPLNFGYYPNAVFRNIVDSSAIDTLYSIFVGKMKNSDDRDSISEELYEKLIDSCSSEVKNISYADLKDKLQYLFFEFIVK